MNIRGALDEIIRLYGHYIVYARRDIRFKCECYSERNGEARGDCKKCLGTGYSLSFEKMKVRYQIARSTAGEYIAAAGTKVPLGSIYYLPERYHPKNGDLILEVEWDGELVKNIREKKFISVADPKLGVEGRIEFYQVLCKFEESRDYDDKTIASSSVSSIATEL